MGDSFRTANYATSMMRGLRFHRTMPEQPSLTPEEAAERLDAHVRDIVSWHFSQETGSPFWLDWARQAGWDPAKEVQTYADLRRFPHFQDEWLRDEPNERWVPKAYQGR